MAERMKAFDKCIDQLLDAVTSDMIHVENLADDIGKALKMKITREKKKRLETIRSDTLAEFRGQVKEAVEKELKPKFNLQECFDDLEIKEQKTKKGVDAWRINGDPQHDTYAQRRPVYVDYIAQLDNATEELEAERERLLKELSS